MWDGCTQIWLHIASAIKQKRLFINSGSLSAVLPRWVQAHYSSNQSQVIIQLSALRAKPDPFLESGDLEKISRFALGCQDRCLLKQRDNFCSLAMSFCPAHELCCTNVRLTLHSPDGYKVSKSVHSAGLYWSLKQMEPRIQYHIQVLDRHRSSGSLIIVTRPRGNILGRSRTSKKD